MNLNQTPSANRIHIGIFGRRNAGKSSLINALTGQNLAIVSDVAGTTTDPVSKAMELLPLGPVVFIDTPGLDDSGELGMMRVEKTYQTLRKTDLAILVIDSLVGITAEDKNILAKIKEKEIPYAVVYNKCDVNGVPLPKDVFAVSAKTGVGIRELKEKLATLVPAFTQTRYIIADVIQPLDVVVLVIPIDESAPKGRLILPQQQTLRELLDIGAIAIVTKDTELEATLQKLTQKPKLVITDSQVFSKVSRIVPEDILLTSFSILFARYKGNLDVLIHGAHTLDELKDNDKVLISEGCTHHRQCNDIGTVKLPNWIKKHSGKNLQFSFTSGGEFPEDLSDYRLIIHCGGCMLNQKEMEHRIQKAMDANVPITNYGTAIAHMNGILERGCSFKK